MNQEIDSFQLIKSAVRLSDYASRYSDDVKQTGSSKRFRSHCFIHGGDNKNSLSLDNERGLFKCFVCGASGSIIDMWMAINDNHSIPEALQGLSEELAVQLPESESRSKLPSRRRMYDAMDIVAEDATDYLLHSKDDEARAARRYLKSRGIGKKIVNEWRLGMLPEGEDSIDMILDVCEDERALEAAGILKSNRDGSLWTQFNGRLLFPILDEKDRVLSFGGRIVPDVECDLKNSKYINTTTTPIYEKNKVLYGMHRHSKKVEHVITVEGYLDVIALNQMFIEFGIDDMVALGACGTSLSTEHLPLITQGENLTFMFDGDQAGQKAMIRSMWTLNYMENGVSAVVLDDESDPWDMYRDDCEELYQSIFRGGSYINQVVRYQWDALEGSRTEMDSWVKNTATTFSYSSHREQFLTAAAEVIGQQPQSYKRQLAVPVRIRDGVSNKRDQEVLSPHTSMVIRFLLALDQEEQEAILMSLRRWTDRTERAVSNWLPTGNDFDVQAIKRMCLGIGARVPVEVESAIANMYDANNEIEDISVILKGIARQILGGIYDLTQRGAVIGYLADQISVLRRVIDAVEYREMQPKMLAFLIDSSLEIERMSEKFEAESVA